MKKLTDKTNFKQTFLSFSLGKSINFLLAIPLFFILGCQSVSQTGMNLELPLNNQMVIAGLKQALEIGTKNSVENLSQLGGFDSAGLSKIVAPKEFKSLVKTLNTLGMGKFVKQFESQLNRTAESVAKESKHVLLKSISQMSVSDGWKILKGADNEATEYFRKTSTVELTSKIKPIISESMSKIGFYKDYKSLLGAYNAIPFTSKPDLDIENYILDATLDGLFSSIAKEEKKIREQPTARVTDLLQRVFSK